MAKTQIAFCCIGTEADAAMYFQGATFEEIVPTSTSAATTAAATPSQGFCRVSTDTAVYVTFGTSPTATSSNSFWLPANTVGVFRVASGSKAAVKT